MIEFAFYGNASAKGFTPLAHRREQELARARVLIEHVDGRIVREYHDIGISPRVPWADRPQGAALLKDLTRVDRGFGAVVVTDLGRAFGACDPEVLPAFAQAGVQVWVPGLKDPFDLDDPVHRLYMSVFTGNADHDRAPSAQRRTMKKGRA